MSENLYNKDLNLKGIDTGKEQSEINTENNNTEIIENNNSEIIENNIVETEPVKTTEPEKNKDSKTKSESETFISPDDRESNYLDATEPTDFIGKVVQGLGDENKSGVKGLGILFAKDYEEAVAPVNLAELIPDALERKKYIEENGSALVKLDESIYGVTFERDVKDLIEFKQTRYPKQMKKFLDDLDDSQGFLSESINTLFRLGGLVTTNIIGGTLGIGYGAVKSVLNSGSSLYSSLSPLGSSHGAVKSIITWDAQSLFDNEFLRGLDEVSEWVTEKTVIYGGSDVYNYNNDTGIFEQKEFFARFASDPLKGISREITPAASFIIGAITTELIWSGITAATGGGGSSALAANTARLLNQGKKVFGAFGVATKGYGKTLKALRGVDNALEGINNVKAYTRAKGVSDFFLGTANTLGRAYRSAGYESAMIGREAKDGTLAGLLAQYHKENGGELDEYGNPIGDIIEPDAALMAEFQELADKAGLYAYGINIPLVAASNFIMIPSIFGKALPKSAYLGKLRRSVKRKTGTTGIKGVGRKKSGEYAAFADKSKLGKTIHVLGYPTAILSKGATEAFEEAAQYGITGGTIDYFVDSYSQDNAVSLSGMLWASAQKTTKVLETAEGRESVYIGGLMGLLGVAAPIKTNKETGKVSFGLSWQGGFAEAIRNKKSKLKKAREKADKLNKATTVAQEVLARNFKAAGNHMASMKKMGEAAEKGDIHEVKNEDFNQLFNTLITAENNDTTEVILQELDLAEKASLDEFNKLNTVEGQEKYTEETKKEAIKNAKKRVNSIVQDIRTVKKLINSNKTPGPLSPAGLIKKVRKLMGKPEKGKLTTEELLQYETVTNQFASLYAKINDFKKREQDVENSITQKTKNTFDASFLNSVKVTANSIEYNKDEKEVKVTFNSQEKETEQAAIEQLEKDILQKWEKEDVENYSKHKETIRQEIQDLIKIKLNRAKAVAMYNLLFTKKGAEKFRDIAAHAMLEHAKAIFKEIETKENEAGTRTNHSPTAKNARENLETLGLNTDKIDAKEVEEIGKAIKEYQNLNLDMIPPEERGQEIANKILKKYPHVFNLLLKSNPEKYSNIGTVEEMMLQETDSYELTSGIPTFMNNLANAFNTFQKNQAENFDSSESMNKPGANTNTTNDSNVHKDQEKNQVFVNVFQYKTEKVNGIIKIVRDSEGNPIPHESRSNNNGRLNKIDFEKINSPEFLNNEFIEKNNPEVELVVPDVPFNKEKGRTANDIYIEVVYTDPVTNEKTVLGFIPSANENSSENLTELRQAVKKQNDAIQGTNTDSVSQSLIETLKANKAKAKEKLDNLRKSNANQAEINKATAEFNQASKALKEEAVKGLDITLIPKDENKKKLRKEIEKYLKTSKIDKDLAQNKKTKIINEFGEAEFNRALAIEENFDYIVEQFAQTGLNIFVDPETNPNKKCE